MTKREKKRLLNVAKALRESPAPAHFTMCGYGTKCGTPQCALGHYAARGDLQRKFYLGRDSFQDDGVVRTLAGTKLDFESPAITEHFGLDKDRGEASKLFGPNGCDNARDPLSAALFIERFVESKS